MPMLEILDPDGNLQTNSSGLLLAYATYPADEDAQEEYANVLICDQLFTDICEKEERGEEVTFEPCTELLATLLDSRPPESVYEQAQESVSQGEITGKLSLMCLWTRYSFPERRTSIEKNIAILTEMFESSSADFEPLPKDRTIWNRWTKFKSVSHIHAAFEWICWSTEPAEVEETVCRFLFNHLRFTLSLSETIRKEMERLDIVKPDELYSAPASLKLESIELDFPPFPEEFVYLLD